MLLLVLRSLLYITHKLRTAMATIESLYGVMHVYALLGSYIMYFDVVC